MKSPLGVSVYQHKRRFMKGRFWNFGRKRASPALKPRSPSSGRKGRCTVIFGAENESFPWLGDLCVVTNPCPCTVILRTLSPRVGGNMRNPRFRSSMTGLSRISSASDGVNCINPIGWAVEIERLPVLSRCGVQAPVAKMTISAEIAVSDKVRTPVIFFFCLPCIFFVISPVTVPFLPAMNDTPAIVHFLAKWAMLLSASAHPLSVFQYPLVIDKSPWIPGYSFVTSLPSNPWRDLPMPSFSRFRFDWSMYGFTVDPWDWTHRSPLRLKNSEYSFFQPSKASRPMRA